MNRICTKDMPICRIAHDERGLSILPPGSHHVRRHLEMAFVEARFLQALTGDEVSIPRQSRGLWEPLKAAFPCRSIQASLHSVNASPSLSRRSLVS